MYKYKLCLRTGGLMEDPEWHCDMINDVEADNLKEAKDKWAEVTGENKRDTWNSDRKTVWGWSVMVLATNDPTVESKDYMYSIK